MAAFAQRVITNPDTLSLKDLLCVLNVYASLNYCVQHNREQYVPYYTLISQSILQYTTTDVCLSVSYFHEADALVCCSRFLQSLSKTLDFYLPRISNYELLKACSCLCLLGHFPSLPLEKLLQGTTLEELSSKGLGPSC